MKLLEIERLPGRCAYAPVGLGLLLVLLLVGPSGAVGPLRLVGGPAGLSAGPEGATALLTLEARRGEGDELASIRLLDVHRASGTPKLHRAPDPGRGPLLVLVDAEDRPLLQARFTVDWVLHGDEPDAATGHLRSLSVRRERVVFVLKVPLLEGARRLLFVEGARGTLASRPGVGRALEGGRLVGEIDLVRSAPGESGADGE